MVLQIIVACVHVLASSAIFSSSVLVLLVVVFSTVSALVETFSLQTMVRNYMGGTIHHSATVLDSDGRYDFNDAPKQLIMFANWLRKAVRKAHQGDTDMFGRGGFDNAFRGQVCECDLSGTLHWPQWIHLPAPHTDEGFFDLNREHTHVAVQVQNVWQAFTNKLPRAAQVERDTYGRANGPIRVELVEVSALAPRRGMTGGTWKFRLWYASPLSEPRVFEFDPGANGKLKEGVEYWDQREYLDANVVGTKAARQAAFDERGWSGYRATPSAGPAPAYANISGPNAPQPARQPPPPPPPPPPGQWEPAQPSPVLVGNIGSSSLPPPPTRPAPAPIPPPPPVPTPTHVNDELQPGMSADPVPGVLVRDVPRPPYSPIAAQTMAEDMVLRELPHPPQPAVPVLVGTHSSAPAEPSPPPAKKAPPSYPLNNPSGVLQLQPLRNHLAKPAPPPLPQLLEDQSALDRNLFFAATFRATAPVVPAEAESTSCTSDSSLWNMI